jgi:uncharacterized protein YndB with AHSA1/START domain
MHGAVTVNMAASPDRVWELVSDVTQIGRYSPETFEAVWIDPATGPALGAKFRGHVKRNGRGPVYWTTCTVTACDPGREFAFGVGNGDTPLNVWSYRLQTVGDTTDVTESFQLADTFGLRLYWLVLGWSRGKTNRDDMRTTLEKMKAVVEADARA